MSLRPKVLVVIMCTISPNSVVTGPVNLLDREKHGRLAGTLIHCVLLRKQTFSFSSVTVKKRLGLG